MLCIFQIKFTGNACVCLRTLGNFPLGPSGTSQDSAWLMDPIHTLRLALEAPWRLLCLVTAPLAGCLISPCSAQGCVCPCTPLITARPRIGASLGHVTSSWQKSLKETLLPSSFPGGEVLC